MTIVVVSLIVVATILLILLVLAQDPKSGGFSSGFSPGQFLGVQKTTDLLEKITWGLAGAMIIFSIATNFLVDKDADAEGINSANIQRAKETGGGAQPAPAQPAPSQQTQPAQGQPTQDQPAEGQPGQGQPTQEQPAQPTPMPQPDGVDPNGK